MAKRRLKMTKKAKAARRRYRARKKGTGGAFFGAKLLGPAGWLLPF